MRARVGGVIAGLAGLASVAGGGPACPPGVACTLGCDASAAATSSSSSSSAACGSSAGDALLRGAGGEEGAGPGCTSRGCVQKEGGRRRRIDGAFTDVPTRAPSGPGAGGATKETAALTVVPAHVVKNVMAAPTATPTVAPVETKIPARSPSAQPTAAPAVPTSSNSSFASTTTPPAPADTSGVDVQVYVRVVVLLAALILICIVAKIVVPFCRRPNIAALDALRQVQMSDLGRRKKKKKKKKAEVAPPKQTYTIIDEDEDEDGAAPGHMPPVYNSGLHDDSFDDDDESGKPYERALQQGKVLDAETGGVGSSELKAKAAAHAQAQQRLKLEKFKETIEEKRGDDEVEAVEGGAEGDEAVKTKAKTKAAAAAEKAEKTLRYAAELAAFTIASVNRGENKTEEALRLELWGDDMSDEIAEALDAAGEDEERPLPSKYLPNALACLVIFAAFSLHALFHLMCHWVVGFRAWMLFGEVDEINNRSHVLIRPRKHKGRATIVPVKSSVGGGLVVVYQREIYEYWGPTDLYVGSEDGDDDDDDDLFKMKPRGEAVAAAPEEKEATAVEEEEEEEVVEVIDERNDLVGLGLENGSLRRITPPIAMSLEHYAAARGLDSRAVEANRERYGANVVEVRVPSFVELYKEQLLSPIAAFQVFTSLLWILDSYWQYVGFTLVSIVMMEAGTVMQRQKTLKSLSGMSAHSAPLFVFRDRRWVELDSEDLLPGDVVSIARRRPPAAKEEDNDDNEKKPPKDSDEAREAEAERVKRKKRAERKIVHVIPCDCVVLRGSAVANEATLTGESTPQMKDALVVDTDRPLDAHGRDRVAVLFSGTELVNASDEDPNDPDTIEEHAHDRVVAGAGAGADANMPPTPDGGCVAFVLRTGFASAQGELVQMIEFSQQSVSSDTRETLGALFVLLLFAMVSAAYVLKRGLEKGDRTTHELVLRCVIIVTSVVPRQLPMQMALAVNTALMALMKAGIMAVEPYRVPFAGRIAYCLFDKTGTLTTDRLVPVGVVCAAEGTGVVHEDPMHAASPAAATVIAACHSLVATAEGAGDLVGDPIELSAIRALKWTYDAKTATAKPPTDLTTFSRKKTTTTPEAPTKPPACSSEIAATPSSVRIVQRHHFSSALQRMSAVAELIADDRSGGAKSLVVLVKGSPEAVKGLLRSGSAPAWFDATYNSLSERGMRVLALACKRLDGATAKTASAKTRAEVESDLVFAGLVAFECKTRADSRVVIESLKESAHKVAMVTGDAPLTALHVARETAIAPPGDQALLLSPDGARWVSPYADARRSPQPYDPDRLPAEDNCALVVTEVALVAASGTSADTATDADDASWAPLARRACVFARMSPQGKAKLCRSLQRTPGTHVLMCGDGGNDVGALKQADVGLALLAGYGDANTTTEGGYAEMGAKLAAAAENNTNSTNIKATKKAVSAEDILNAQADALTTAHEKSVNTRKQKLAAKQKDLMARQREWVDEELAEMAARGETGLGAQFKAISKVAGRLKREMGEEVGRLNSQHGNVFDSTTKKADGEVVDPLTAALGGGAANDENAMPMIRPGDASVAAPFTSRSPSIRAVVDLVRQGRCTLLSSLQQQQIMVLESVISAYTLAALSLEGSRSSERQMMASGWLMVIASMAFSYTKPIDKMSPVRPLASLFDPSIVVSVAGQGLIHILCMRTAVKMATERMGPQALKAVVLFQKRSRAGELAGTVDGSSEDDIMAWFSSMWSTPFLPNLLNTAVWLVETSQMVAVLLVNYKGRPWMRGLLENHALFLSLFLSVAGVALCAWGFVPAVNEAIHLAPFPDDEFRWQLVALVGASVAGTFLWDRLATAVFAPHVFNAMWREALTTTFEDCKPVIFTALKVAAGFALIAYGNIITIAMTLYGYRQWTKRQAALDQARKDAILNLQDSTPPTDDANAKKNN